MKRILYEIELFHSKKTTLAPSYPEKGTKGLKLKNGYVSLLCVRWATTPPNKKAPQTNVNQKRTSKQAVINTILIFQKHNLYKRTAI